MSKEENGGEVPGEGTTGSDALKKDADIYENRGTKKIVRLITVIAYMFSVSFVAIVLSAYYLFIWEAPNPRQIRRPLQFSTDPLMQSLISDRITVEGDSNTSNISFTVRNFDTNNHFNDYDHIRKHEKELNESLLLLRSSLVEALRDKRIVTNHSKSSNWTISEYVNYTLPEKGNTLNLTGRLAGRGLRHSEIMNRTLEEDNFTKKYTINETESTRTMPSDSTGTIMRTIDRKGTVDIERNRENLTYNIGLDVDNKQRYLEENATNGVVNFKETQVERITTKSVTVANEQQSPFTEIVTTQRQKEDILTTLTEIAANTTSSVTPAITFDDLQTDVETKETSTKIDFKLD